MSPYDPTPPDAVRQRTTIGASDLVSNSAALLSEGMRIALVCAFDDVDELRVVYLFTSGPPDRRVELEVRVDKDAPNIPSIARLSFPASRFEREIHDLFGIVPIGHPFLRPLVLHQHWPEDWHPMLHDAQTVPAMRSDADPFPFVRVEGSGVYEIPVGPVHAGLIEPGHFRFSVVGESIIKMKARLWFTHRGIERLFEGRAAESGVELAERVSGDSAVSHNLAYSMAMESARGFEIGESGAQLRSVLLELERVYNHVTDIGALCNDAGFGFAQSKALRLRERLLRLNEAITGHRLLRGAIAPGRVVLRRLPSSSELCAIGTEFEEVVAIALSNTVVVDRLHGTAALSSDDAIGTGALGVVARASGLELDARAAHPFVTLDEKFTVARETNGDVEARFLVRVAEVRSSLALLEQHCDRLGTTQAVGRTGVTGQSGSGVGIVEGFRGSVVYRIEVEANGTITRCKIVDPSFLNWPALSVSLADTIVPDFPLANKSFGLSYAGNDL